MGSFLSQVHDISFGDFTFMDVDYTASSPEKALGFQAPFLAYTHTPTNAHTPVSIITHVSSICNRTNIYTPIHNISIHKVRITPWPAK